MIKDPALLSIRRNFPRPDAAILAGFRGVPTGFLVDAMGGRGALDHRIRALLPGKTDLVGPALTCQAGPADNLAVFGALAAAQRGDIIVAATDGFTKTSVTGDLLLGMARNRGIAGFVTDGLIRDQLGVAAVGLPVFCAGVTPNSPARNGPGAVGLPVVIGDVQVQSGDIVVADVDGVVVVPLTMAEQVFEKLAGIRAAEQALDAKVRDGLEIPDFITAVLESGRVEYLD